MRFRTSSRLFSSGDFVMSDKLTPEDYAELGRFVNQFAFTESIVFLFLTLLLNIPREESAAILSGMKIDGCLQAAKRVFEARAQPVPQNLSDSFDQLASINKFRNDILHRGVTPDGVASNFAKAMTSRAQEFSVSGDILKAATRDLFKITSILISYHGEVEGTELDVALHKGALNAPWLYKQPQPRNTRQQNLTNPHKRPPQHESSQG
jgi:hypothetical protein